MDLIMKLIGFDNEFYNVNAHFDDIDNTFIIPKML